MGERRLGMIVRGRKIPFAGIIEAMSPRPPALPRMIFFDVDGTLRPLHGVISDTIMEMLRRLKEQGILVAIATGRSPVVLPDFGDFRFDAYLTFNGSLSFAGHPENGQVVSATALPRADVEILLRNLADLGRPVLAATKDRLIANGMDENLEEYCHMGGLFFGADPDFASVLAGEEVFQMMAGSPADEYAAILRGVTGARITAWWPRAVDIIPANSGKAAAVKKLHEHFGIAREECWAFGDGANDMDMLDYVGWGVAMGNAPAEVQAIADIVCGDVAEHGVTAYLKATGVLPA